MSDPFQILGTVLDGKYRVDRVLGEGGFGVVYGGLHLIIGQPVAIKCLKQISGAAADQQRFTESFLREARVLFALTHPNIVRLYDVGSVTPRGNPTAAPAPYVVLEYLDGCTLEQEIAARRARGGQHFTAWELRTVFDQVLDALSFAHAQGVIHRDIKPSNVMLIGSGRGLTARLVDFGIARVGGQATTTTGGAFTPRYAAPEQWDTKLGAAGPATDLFALALTLVEAATLDPALPGDSIPELVRAVHDPGCRRSIRAVRADLPPALDAIVSHATRVAQPERIQDAKQMRAQLAQAFDGAAVAAGVMAPSADPRGHVPMLANPSIATAPTAVDSRGCVPATAVSAPVTRPASHGLRTVLFVFTGLAALAIVSIAVIVGLFVLRPKSGERRGRPADKTAPAAVPEAPATSYLPPNLPKVKGHVRLTGVMASSPFHTSADVEPIVRARLGELDACYEHVMRNKRASETTYDLQLMGNKDGTLQMSQCGKRGGNPSTEDEELCTCFEARTSAWRFPPSRGRLGLLDSGVDTITVQARRSGN